MEKTYKAPAGAAAAAKKALKWKEQYPGEVKAMTPTGWARANQLAKGENLSLDTVKRMANFIRHKSNSKIDPKYKSEPWKDRGYVAWLGWGGDVGVNWARRIVDGINSGMTKETVNEKLDPKDDVNVWISDFVRSNAPQFKDKTRKERIKMALAAYKDARDKAGLDEPFESVEHDNNTMSEDFDREDNIGGLIDSIMSGDKESRDTIFNTLISSSVERLLDAKKVAVAKSVYGESYSGITESLSIDADIDDISPKVIKDVSRKYGVKINGNTITGKKSDIIRFLTGPEYGLDVEEVKNIYPKLA